MNILVIGNGFDIAHNLPTKYTDFLDFIKCISEEEPWNTSYDIAHKDYFIKYTKNEDNKYIRKVIIALSKNNKWIEWFKRSAVKENWVDFEAEILKVIQWLDETTQFIGESTQKIKEFDFKEILSRMWKDYDGYLTTEFSIKDIAQIRDDLINDLNNLTRCLGLYLMYYVNKIKITTLSPDIYDLYIDKVLSFNYTDTYSKLYEWKSNEIEYDYIHGKADYWGLVRNDMVLGINEYLPDDTKDSNIMFIEFKKYFQRIYKRTGSIYKTWIEKIIKDKRTSNVYFFGHSLDVTDKDVLRDIILCDKVKVTIYYNTREQYASQIKNLVQVLSQEKLISMVYGENAKIEFRHQRGMIAEEQVRQQIVRDIWTLEKWYNFSDIKLNVVENRIKQAIEEKDINYFYSKQKMIELYDVLILYKKEFAIELFELMDELNTGQLEELQFDNLEHLKVQLINQLKIQKLSERKSIEIVKKLFSMFSTCDNIPLLWECIHLIVLENFKFEQWEAFIEDTIKQSSGIEKKRYEYLKSEIDEKWQMRKRWGVYP